MFKQKSYTIWPVSYKKMKIATNAKMHTVMTQAEGNQLPRTEAEIRHFTLIFQKKSTLLMSLSLNSDLSIH